MRHPGNGARAQYTKEYKRWLDTEYNRTAIKMRCSEARGCVNALTAALSHAETRLHRSALSPAELRAHIRDFGARASKLERTAPDPPPVRSWAAMRSLEMHAYRKPLRSFDKWDDKVCAFIHDAKLIERMLRKLAPQKSLEKSIRRRTDALCKMAPGPRRRFIVLVRN